MLGRYGMRFWEIDAVSTSLWMHWECHHGDNIHSRRLADALGFLAHLLCGIKSGAYVEICLSVIDGDISSMYRLA